MTIAQRWMKSRRQHSQSCPYTTKNTESMKDEESGCHRNKVKLTKRRKYHRTRTRTYCRKKLRKVLELPLRGQKLPGSRCRKFKMGEYIHIKAEYRTLQLQCQFSITKERTGAIKLRTRRMVQMNKWRRTPLHNVRNRKTIATIVGRVGENDKLEWSKKVQKPVISYQQ